ncbi:hypothetical protein LEP1GSC199_0322 [Leptospira vanthielii serovar Holland str. Waz Holland = ATCC 700522]|uniref:Uncharacterized protein n=1 Tax=Leptospira vanthielii serovar Holland str. Waz Holland = ATCC 700522 TaxID=1218591 RepID=N1WBT2_9LEPT|nr:hypothetical protein LEP1GSC199_0322 [Leptospira vanthielii serovar Holland str. Waz Holland = ATCC 700522]
MILTKKRKGKSTNWEWHKKTHLFSGSVLYFSKICKSKSSILFL